MSEYVSDKQESGYWGRYADRLGRLDVETILEVGVLRGASLDGWAAMFPDAEVVGIDLTDPGRESDHWDFYQADQRDPEALARVTRAYGGMWSLVVDDASHLADATRVTFETLWPSVAPGGCYVVEDWGTGYWEGWPDGEAPRAAPGPGGHTAGMVGLVKSLVDLVRDNGSGLGGDIASIEFVPGQVFIWKSA